MSVSCKSVSSVGGSGVSVRREAEEKAGIQKYGYSIDRDP